MSLVDQISEEYLDMTQTELKECDDFDSDEELVAEEEFKEHVGDMHAAFEVYAASVLLARMFDDDRITLGEYLEIIEHVEDYERDLDATLL